MLLTGRAFSAAPTPQRRAATPPAAKRELASADELDEAETHHRAERLDALNQQLVAAENAFLAFDDPGDNESRSRVITSLQKMMEDLSQLVAEYRWVLSLRNRLRNAPGDSDASEALKKALASSQRLAAEVAEDLPELPRAIGHWLEQSQAVSPFGSPDDPAVDLEIPA